MRALVRWWAWLLVVVGLGCAQAPTVEKVRPYTFETGRTPYSAAICIARNAKGLAGITAEERLQGDTAWEVVVRETSSNVKVLAVALIQLRGNGSLVSVRVTDAPHGNQASFARQLMSDCQAQRVER